MLFVNIVLVLVVGATLCWSQFSRNISNKVLQISLDGSVVGVQEKLLWDYGDCNSFASYTNFQGRKLRLAMIDNLPFLGIETTSTGRRIVTDGIDFHILQAMASYLNFSYDIVEEPNNVWGTTLLNGTPTGLMYMVHSGAADFAIDEITITEAREKSIDFTYPYYTEPTISISQSPKRQSQAWVVFTPLNYDVWMILLISLALAGPLKYLADKILLGGENQKKMNRYSFEAFTIIAKQNAKLQLRSTQGMIITGSWLLFCFLSQVFYTSSLITFVTIPRKEKPIDSLHELLQFINNDKTYLVLLYGTSHESIFKDSEGGIYRELYNVFDPELGSVRSDHEGYQKVWKTGGVYINTLLNSKLFTSSFGRHNFYIGREVFNPQSYGIVFPSDSPYLPAVNKFLSLVVESGLISKWSDDMVYKSAVVSDRQSTSTGNSGNGHPSLSIKNLQGAFVVLGLGFVPAVIAFACEIFLHMRPRTTK